MNIFIGLLLITALSAVLLAVLWKFNIRSRQVYVLFGISLFIHVAAVLFIHFAHFQPFSGGGGDYSSYHKSAVLIQSGIAEGHLFPDADERGGVPHLYPTIIGYVYFITTPAMVVGQLFNAWIATVVILLLYFLVLEVTQSTRSAASIALIANLYPSFLFYSSLLLKDVFVVLFALLAALTMLHILRQFSWKKFILFYALLIALTNFRFYLGFVLLIAFTISWFVLSRESIKTRFVYGVGMILLLGFVPQMFGMGYYGFSTLRQYTNPEVVTYYQDIAYTGKDVASSSSPTPVTPTSTPPAVSPSSMPLAAPTPTPAPETSSPVLIPTLASELNEGSTEENTGFASTVDLKVNFESPGAFVVSFFKSFAFVSIGPFPWQFAAPRHYFVLLETIPWTILSVLILLGVINSVRSRHRILSLAILSIGIFIILAIYMNNFGITTRIRMPALLLLSSFIPFGMVEFGRWKDLIIKYFKS